MQIKYNYLFNFSASYMGGGLKRLRAHTKWFDQNGGASFIIHPNCESLMYEFPNNRFFVVKISRLERLFNDCQYLEYIRNEIGEPKFYYSYGIPIYARFGEINWFHLSNVLPLNALNIPLSLIDKIFKMPVLGWKIRKNYINADIISAESSFSLSLINVREVEKLFLSVNGSDEELGCLEADYKQPKDHIATVVGTHKYKSVKDSYLVFEMLKQKESSLKLMIIGDEKALSKDLLEKKDVIIKGILKESEVIDCLRKTKYYISTTLIENSWNAASEGVLFADSSYLSNIGPHRELLLNVPFDSVKIPGMVSPLIYVNNGCMAALNLKTWEQIIADMIAKVNAMEGLHKSSPQPLVR